MWDGPGGADTVARGPSILTVDVLDASRSARLQVGGGSEAWLSGVPPTAITANDILFIKRISDGRNFVSLADPARTPRRI
ncbi:hypothetical protein CRT23_17300 [Methylobacterium sp. V23]|nr:hypothetical protein CRT23_17300 [Methylobacterium sp. V23]